jgi:NAD(P)-dependent dehydrogenase (short-subunit alcohol dehydrogenase family)
MANEIDQSGLNDDGSSKIALLYGAGSGIGKATALDLHRRGWNTVIFDLSAESGGQIEAELNAVRPHSALALCGDVTAEGSINSALEQIKSKFGKLNLVVSTVGIVSVDFGSEVNVTALEKMLSINLVGNLRAAQLAAPLLAQARAAGEDASLIVVTSVAAHVLLAERGGYSISKAALEMAIRHLMLNWTAVDIDVTGIAPGRVATELVFGRNGWVLKHPPEHRFRKVAEACGTQRAGTMMLPEDLARQIGDLARPDSILRNTIIDASDGWYLGFSGHNPEQMPKRFYSFLEAISKRFPECEIPRM